MVFRLLKLHRLVVASSAFLLIAGAAPAQTVKLEVEAGSRGIFGDRTAAKFLEYSSIPKGLFLGNANLQLDWGELGYYLNFRTQDALEGDQSVQVRAGRQGQYELSVEFDKIPHLFSNSGRSIFLDGGDGQYTLPDSVQSDLRKILATDTNPQTAGVQPDLAALGALINGLAQPVDLSLMREKGKVSFRYTPTPAWDLQVQYTQENQRGGRPFGAAFAFNPQEQTEPTNYTTRELQVTAERSGKNWMLSTGLTARFFRNHVNALVWDNPFRQTDTAGTPARGRIDLYPDNVSRQGMLSAGIRLPLHGWWTGSATYGVASQNDSLLPFTINSAITGVPALPETTPHARFETLQFNSSLTLKPTSKLNLGLRYRYHDRNNEKPAVTFSNYVRTDNQLANVTRVTVPFAYTIRTASADATWRIFPYLALKGGYTTEEWAREFRDVLSTDETTVNAGIDVTRGGWFLFRASHRVSDREAIGYNGARADSQSFPVTIPNPTFAGLRRFDMADRARKQDEVIVRLNHGDRFSLSTSYSRINEDMKESAYGLLESTRDNPAVSLSYAFGFGLNVSADYAHEDIHRKMQSRQRTATNDNTANDWASDIREVVNTYGGAISQSLDSGKISMDLSYQRSKGSSLTKTATLGTPTLTVVAQDFPKVISDLQSLRATTSYSLGPRTAIGFEYRFERYYQVDWALDVMAPFMGFVDAGSAGTTWVGATRPDFRTHVAQVSVTYRF